MGITALPWFFHVDHIAAGLSTNYATGDGIFDTIAGNAQIVTRGSVRRLRLNVDTFNDGDAQVGFPSSDKVVVGFLFQAGGDWSGGNTTGYVISLDSGGTANLNLFADGNGNLQVRRGTTTLETININVADEVQRYIEVAVHLDNAGSYEVRYDGVTVASAASVDTTDGGNADVLRFGRGALGGTNGRDFDYAYIYLKEWDDASTPGFLGPLVFHTLDPTADVATQWAPDSGVDNFDRVNEASIDDDASYVETSDLGDVDEYTLSDLPASVENVVAVVAGTVATAPSGGAPLIEHGLDRGASQAYGPARSLSGAYRTQIAVHETAPDGSAWTPTKVDESSLLLRSA